jgi:hypothetical protein
LGTFKLNSEQKWVKIWKLYFLILMGF